MRTRTGRQPAPFGIGFGVDAITRRPLGPIAALRLLFNGTLPSQVGFARASNAGYFDYAGNYQLAASDTPRFDFDPQTLRLRGLLIEQQMTNNVTRSEATNGTAGTNAAAPSTIFGVAARRFTGNGAAATHFASADSITQTSGTLYTISAYVRYVNAQFIQLATALGASAATVYANFDLVNGTVTATGGTASSRITACGGGIFRCEITYTASATVAGAPVEIYLCSTGTDARAPSNSLATSFDFIGMQHEAAPIATSFIQTTGTAQTRLADQVTLTGTNFSAWYNQAGGTLRVKGLFPFSDPTNSRRWWEVSDGSSANRIQATRQPGVSTAASQGVSTVAGVSTFSPTTANAVGAATLACIVQMFSSSGKKLVLNGGTVMTNATAVPVSGLTQLIIGSVVGFNSVNTLQGWVQSLEFFNKRDFTDAELQALSV